MVKRKPNPKASLFALILQTEERKCLLAIDEFMKQHDRQADILIHDGLEVRKLPNEAHFPKELLRKCETFILEHTGYTMKLTEKPFVHNFVMPDKEIHINDRYACQVFVNLMDEDICRDGDDIYYFNAMNGLWETGKTAFLTAVGNFRNELCFERKEKLIDYGGNSRNVANMKTWLNSLVPDTEFISKKANSSLGKLLFARYF